MTELTDAFGCDDLREQATRIRGLARAVAGDRDTADDLTQELMLHELERRDARETPRSLAWLFVALRNLASKHRRAATRRTARERAAARDERVPAPDDALQHAETLQRVVAAALALDEPYRSVILLRYLEGRTVREVALATGVPDATVRVRTMRAIERLRERLRRDLGKGWALLLFDLAGPMPLPAAPVVPSSSALTKTGGNLSMKIKLSFATAGLGVVALAIGVIAQDPERVRVVERAPREIAPPAAVVESSTAAPVREVVAAPPVPAVVPEAGNGAFALPPLRGTVIDHRGKPVADATVRVFTRAFEGAEALASGDATPPPVVARTDASGAWRIDALHPFATWGIEARAEGFAPSTHMQRADAPTAITLFPSADLHGTVRDADSGKALAGVIVRVREVFYDGEHVWLSRKVETNARGGYRLTGVAAETELQVEFVRPGMVSCRSMLTLRAGIDNEHDLALGASAALDVLVLDAATKRPVEGAAVHDHGFERDPVGTTGRDGRLRVAVAQVEGARTAHEYAERSHVVAHAKGYCATSTWLPVLGRGEARELTLALVRGGRIEGIVRDKSGEPVAGAHVGWQSPPLRWVEPSGFASVGPDANGALTGADGRFALADVPISDSVMEGELRAWKGGATAVVGRALPKATDTTREIEFVLGTGVTIAGTTTVNGRPMVTYLSLESTDGAGRTARTQATADGRYAFFDVATGAYEVSAVTGDGTAIASEPRRVDVAEAVDGIDLDIRAELAFIHGRVLMDDGMPAVGRTVLAFATGRGEARAPQRVDEPESFALEVDGPDGAVGFQMIASTAEVQADGSFELALSPDARARYRLGVYQGGFGIIANGVWQGAHDVEIRVPRLAHVAVELVSAKDGRPIESAGVKFTHAATKRDVTLAWQQPRPTSNGVLDLELPLGDVELRVRDGASGREARATVHVAEEGVAERVRIEL